MNRPMNAAQAIRVQSDVPLDDEQMQALTQMADYASEAAAAHPQTIQSPRRESPYSFVVKVDTAESHLAEHLVDRFEPALRDYVADGGTPRRKSDGSRLVSGLGDGRRIELFYDETDG